MKIVTAVPTITNPVLSARDNANGCSDRHLVLVSIIAEAYKMADNIGSSAYQLKSLTLGLSISNTPRNPSATANHPTEVTLSPVKGQVGQRNIVTDPHRNQ